MLTPRNRKPVAIPSIEPVAAGRAVVVGRAAASVTRLSARVLVRAGALFRPRGDRPDVHRRLVDRRSGTRAAATAATGETRARPASTFHGSTARFVAFG